MHDQEQIREGEWRLRGLLPRARKVAQENPMNVTDISGLTDSMRPFLFEANFQALVVFPGEKGGWLVDLMLKTAPPGQPNIFGTTVQEPFETKTEAIDAGIELLAMALNLYREDAPSVPVFLLHNYQFFLNPKALEACAQIAQQMFQGELTPRQKHDREQYLEARLERAGLDKSFSEAAWDAVPEQEKMQLVSSMHACAVTGVLAYPFRRAFAPGEWKAPT